MSDLDKRLKFNFQSEAGPKTSSLFERINSNLLVLIQSVRGIRIQFPSIYQVFGKVDIGKIDQLPSVNILNFPNLSADFKVIARAIEDAQIKTLRAIEATKTQIPEGFKIENKIKIENWEDLLDGIEELKKGFNLLINKEKRGGEGMPMEVSISNFPPQMVPTPVTRIDINPLRGELTSSLVSVGTTPTPLPGTALARRRSLIIFNNDSSKTVYIGGANVSASGTNTGLPVLSQTYCPAIDAGPQMILYGVVATGSANVVTLEASNDYGTLSTSVGNI